ncbi:MAG: diguanylate cyclase domain-containing protein [Halomonas sp.]
MLLTLSAGVAELGADENADGLMERADRALYRAKEAGRNRVLEAEPAGMGRAPETG